MYEQYINGIELAWRARNVCVGMCAGAFVLADVFPLLDREGEGRTRDVFV